MSRPLRIVITGADGQVGNALKRLAQEQGLDHLALNRQGLDITNGEQIQAVMGQYQPSLLINCAAYTNVDGAEKEGDLARAINSEGPGLLAHACHQAGIPLFHISTDYVFAGQANEPYSEKNETSPLGAYGQTKYEGEELVRQTLAEHIIVRTSWVYSDHGHNFVRTMLRLGQERDRLKVVADQHGCPTAAHHLAHFLLHLARLHRDQGQLNWSTYHFCTGPATSWHGFASAIMIEAKGQGLLERDIKVEPITTREFPTPAKRPAYSVLNCDKAAATFAYTIPNWHEGLAQVLASLKLATP